MVAASVGDKAEVTTKRTTASGMALSVGLEAGGDGASVGMKAMRKHQTHKHTEEGSGREMALRLLKSLAVRSARTHRARWRCARCGRDRGPREEQQGLPRSRACLIGLIPSAVMLVHDVILTAALGRIAYHRQSERDARLHGDLHRARAAARDAQRAELALLTDADCWFGRILATRLSQTVPK